MEWQCKQHELFMDWSDSRGSTASASYAIAVAAVANVAQNAPAARENKTMIGGVNPWISMWTKPRFTLRSIINVDPKYGIYLLASIYVLQSSFFFASYWALGLSFSF